LSHASRSGRDRGRPLGRGTATARIAGPGPSSSDAWPAVRANPTGRPRPHSATRWTLVP
jgi:hypothetical protein